MAGFDIYIYGTDTRDNYPVSSDDWLKLSILGLNFEQLPRGEARSAPLGGYLHPRTSEKTITIKCQPIASADWFDFISSLTSHLTKAFVYYRRGTYLSASATLLPDNSRIIPTGRSVTHNYQYGNKSIDVECVIYE